MKIFGYARVSTDKQDTSASAQQEKIKAWALLNDHELIGVEVDIDEFSGDLKRPGIQRVLEMVRGKKIDGVIITKLDRLTRSVSDTSDLMALFRKTGVQIIDISQALDFATATGRLVVGMRALIAQYEREITGERTSDCLQNLKTQGLPAGPAPYGFTSQPRTSEEKILRIRKPLLVNESEQSILILARSMRNSGLSYERIANALNEHGHLTRSGIPWVKQYVVGILKSTREVAA